MGDRCALLINNRVFEDSGLVNVGNNGEATSESFEELLADSEVGGYKIEAITDPGCQSARIAIAKFCRDRGRDDALLVYYHSLGMRDISGFLYFAARDTDRELLSATGVGADFLVRQLDLCRSSDKVAVLDCTFSGAVLSGLPAPLRVMLLTSSGPHEFAFAEGYPQHGLLTSALAEGLASGDADLDGDGLITWDELSNYAKQRVEGQSNGQQHPRVFNLSYRTAIAGRVKRPVFISYAGEDADFAEQVRRLIENEGHRVWINEQSILGGDDWRDKLSKAIDSAKLVVVIASTSGLQSPWVRRELLYADKVGKPILPLIREPVRIPAWFEFQFGGIQYLQLTDETPEPAIASAIHQSVRRLLRTHASQALRGD